MQKGVIPLELFRLLGTIAINNKEANAALDETSNKGEKSEKKLSQSFGKIGKSALKIGTAMAGAAVAAGAALVKIAEDTREYRAEMGKLEAAFSTAGHSSEAAMNTFNSLNAVLGETDQAVEASNHLAKLVTDEKDLATWTNICTGVYATFGASLPIEGLTEAANETSRTGQLTGGLADALNWAGVNEEDFQASLDKCTTQQERQALITKTLNGLYDDAAQKYKEVNKEVLEANEAQGKLDEGLAAVGKVVEPVITKMKYFAGTVLLKLVDVTVTKVIPAVKSMATWFKDTFKKIEDTVKKAKDIGTNIVKGIANGITNAKQYVIDKITGLGQDILNGIKGFFGIHSPSKVMEDEVGVQLALGVAEGIDKGKEKAKKSAEEMGQEILEAADQTLKEYKRVHDMSIAQEASYWAAIVQQTKKGTDARLEAEDRYYSALESYKQQYNDYVNSIMNQTGLFEAFGKDEDPVAGYTLIRNLESQVGGLTMYYDTLDSLHSKIGGTKLMEALEQMGVDSLNELNAINNMTDAQLQEYVNLYELKYALATQKATEALGTIEKETKKSTDNSNKTAKTALTKMTENFKTYTENMASTTKSKFDKIYSSISSNMAAAVAAVRSAVAQMNAALADAPTGGDVSVTTGGNVAPHAAGGILTKPTIFGYTPSTNTWHLGGEAGAEAIAPIDVLQGYVRSAVADVMKDNSNGQVVNLLEQMVELMARNSNVKLEISGREFGRMVKEYA